MGYSSILHQITSYAVYKHINSLLDDYEWPQIVKDHKSHLKFYLPAFSHIGGLLNHQAVGNSAHNPHLTERAGITFFVDALLTIAEGSHAEKDKLVKLATYIASAAGLNDVEKHILQQNHKIAFAVNLDESVVIKAALYWCTQDANILKPTDLNDTEYDYFYRGVLCVHDAISGPFPYSEDELALGWLSFYKRDAVKRHEAIKVWEQLSQHDIFDDAAKAEISLMFSGEAV